MDRLSMNLGANFAAKDFAGGIEKDKQVAQRRKPIANEKVREDVNVSATDVVEIGQDSYRNFSTYTYNARGMVKDGDNRLSYKAQAEYSSETVSFTAENENGEKLTFTFSQEQLAAKVKVKSAESASKDVKSDVPDYIKQMQDKVERYAKMFRKSLEGNKGTNANDNFKLDLSVKYQSVKVEVTGDADAISNLGDYSPETVAKNVLDFAKSLYQNQGGDFKKAFGDIRKGIEDGFKQARHILGGFADKVDDTITKTYNLIQEGLKDWEKEMQQESKEEKSVS